MVLDMIGGSGPRNGCCLRRYVKNAPASVARLPKIMSGRIAPPRILAVRHPINKPGIAAGVKSGRIVSASEMRTCISPKLNGAKTRVRTT